MREITVPASDAGQRLDKFIKRILPEAPASFVYKMLRKKNITLNGKKAQGSEQVVKGDVIKLFLAEETIAKFGAAASADEGNSEYEDAYRKLSKYISKDSIIFENDQVLLLNKPAGVLSQKSSPDDCSVNEWLIGYMLSKSECTRSDLAHFKPSVCNRLDRNTAGILTAGKTLAASRELTQLLGSRHVKKYYRMIVSGTPDGSGVIEGYLSKDPVGNKVSFSPEETEGSRYSCTKYTVLQKGKNNSLVEAELVTGRSHQLRVHMSSIGCPIIGDAKYGTGESIEKSVKLSVRYQMLYCCRMEFPELEGALHGLSGMTVTAPAPAVFRKLLQEL